MLILLFSEAVTVKMTAWLMKRAQEKPIYPSQILATQSLSPPPISFSLPHGPLSQIRHCSLSALPPSLRSPSCSALLRGPLVLGAGLQRRRPLAVQEPRRSAQQAAAVRRQPAALWWRGGRCDGSLDGLDRPVMGLAGSSRVFPFLFY